MFSLLMRAGASAAATNSTSATGAPSSQGPHGSGPPGGPHGPPGPPYPPTNALLGGQPSGEVDNLVIAILLLLFVTAAVWHMSVFLMNRRLGHKFMFSLLVFIFCMARIVALVIRLVWAANPKDITIGIAAQILTAAGVLLLFIINIIFSQRILRAYRPWLGWHKATKVVFTFLFVSPIAVLIMVIVATVQSFYTLDFATRTRDRNIQLFASTYLAVMAFLPILIVTLTVRLPRQNRIEKFGAGSFHTKIILLYATSALLTLGAAFRAGVQFQVRPLSDPAWFQSRACFYFFNFVIELAVVFALAASRFDRRFHVPDGASGPGSYASGPAYYYTYHDQNQSHASQMTVHDDGEKGPHPQKVLHRRQSRESAVRVAEAVRPGSYAVRHSALSGLTVVRGAGDPRSSYWSDNGKAVAAYASAHNASSSQHGPFDPSDTAYHGSGGGYATDSDQTVVGDREWMERAMRELYGEGGSGQSPIQGPAPKPWR